MKNITVISGSARPRRNSHQVAIAIKDQLNSYDDINSSLVDVLELSLPLLADVFANMKNPPDKITDFSNTILHSDGIIIVSPEHNGTYSGALKNTMDYLHKEYQSKKFGIVGVSTGALGGVNAMKNLQSYVLHLGGLPYPKSLLTPRVNAIFDVGKITDQTYKSRMDKFLSGFIEFIS